MQSGVYATNMAGFLHRQIPPIRWTGTCTPKHLLDVAILEKYLLFPSQEGTFTPGGFHGVLLVFFYTKTVPRTMMKR